MVNWLVSLNEMTLEMINQSNNELFYKERLILVSGDVWID